MILYLSPLEVHAYIILVITYNFHAALSLSLFLSRQIHRLFVADPPLMKPEAVISLTDLLRHLLPEAMVHVPARKSLVA